MGREGYAWLFDDRDVAFDESRLKEHIRKEHDYLNRVKVEDEGYGVFINCRTDENGLVAFKRIAVGDRKWNLIVELPYSEIADPINSHARDIFGLVGFVVLVFGTGGVLLFRVQKEKTELEAETKYLKEIAESAEALQRSHNELEVRVEERTAELAKANEQLKRRIEERKAAEEALQKAHDELERRVEKRTAELTNTNEQLVWEITERKQAEEHVHTLTQQLMQAQESERHRISRDLHDNVAQDLSAAKVFCETLFYGQPVVPSEIRRRVSKLSKILKGSIMAVRDLSYDLRPLGLDQLGLVHAIFQYCEDFSEKIGVSVDFNSVGVDDLRLDFDTAINLYRVIQEALNNVKHHADAGYVTISLVASFPEIVLRIEDDGKGFDMKNRLIAALDEKRMGLRSMEERVRLLYGKMKIQSLPMRGTNILIEVPYKTTS